MPVKRTTSAELQFLVDNNDWFVCRLDNVRSSTKESLALIVQAEAWMEEHCEPDTAFRFSNTFYFKNEEDHLRFTLTWL